MVVSKTFMNFLFAWAGLSRYFMVTRVLLAENSQAENQLDEFGEYAWVGGCHCVGVDKKQKLGKI